MYRPVEQRASNCKPITNKTAKRRSFKATRRGCNTAVHSWRTQQRFGVVELKWKNLEEQKKITEIKRKITDLKLMREIRHKSHLKLQQSHLCVPPVAG